MLQLEVMHCNKRHDSSKAMGPMRPLRPLRILRVSGFHRWNSGRRSKSGIQEDEPGEQRAGGPHHQTMLRNSVPVNQLSLMVGSPVVHVMSAPVARLRGIRLRVLSYATFISSCILSETSRVWKTFWE